MEKYPMLNLTVRYGGPASMAFALVVGALLLWLGFATMGWGAMIVAAIGGALVFVVLKSYVELVVLVTEMLVPR